MCYFCRLVSNRLVGLLVAEGLWVFRVWLVLAFFSINYKEGRQIMLKKNNSTKTFMCLILNLVMNQYDFYHVTS